MRRKKLRSLVMVICLVILSAKLVACKQDTIGTTEGLEKNEIEEVEEETIEEEEIVPTIEEIKEAIVSKYESKTPTQWGESVQGVTNFINTDEKVIFLTFDACGGSGGSGFDKELIDLLINEQIEANLFINNRWIELNMEIFKELASNDLFAIESHGYEHRPLSVNGKAIYGINGTKSVENVFDELTVNDEVIEEITGEKPKFFRSGTAYYDEISVEIAKELGKEIAGFNILGDGGATFSKSEIINRFSNPDNGSIAILHMNQPQSYVYEAMREVIPQLKREGYTFKKLRDYV